MREEMYDDAHARKQEALDLVSLLQKSKGHLVRQTIRVNSSVDLESQVRKSRDGCWGVSACCCYHDDGNHAYTFKGEAHMQEEGGPSVNVSHKRCWL